MVPGEPLPAGMPVLVVFNWFIELILRGVKTVEMRSASSTHVGKRIALCVSGAGGRCDRKCDTGGWVILGDVYFESQLNRSDLRGDAWQQSVQEAACVGGEVWPEKYPWIYRFTDVRAYTEPVYISNQRGHQGEGTVWRTFGESWLRTASKRAH